MEKEEAHHKPTKKLMPHLPLSLEEVVADLLKVKPPAREPMVEQPKPKRKRTPKK